jgi:hypothetical protein
MNHRIEPDWVLKIGVKDDKVVSLDWYNGADIFKLPELLFNAKQRREARRYLNRILRQARRMNK